ncbi:uncharacterized protein LOC113565514 [Drosophila persimilis]|uniref:uncharacterized protein LOC113565514 n=1 Tax=Drosophila persimilis TaxID=7234 RepID=UPI000F07740D|nr:uncharacterized protein LOC113565514 [Drosophila persimilis]
MNVLRRCTHYCDRLSFSTMLYLIDSDRLYWPRPSLATNCYAAISTSYSASRWPVSGAKSTTCVTGDRPHSFIRDFTSGSGHSWPLSPSLQSARRRYLFSS